MDLIDLFSYFFQSLLFTININIYIAVDIAITIDIAVTVAIAIIAIHFLKFLLIKVPDNVLTRVLRSSIYNQNTQILSNLTTT